MPPLCGVVTIRSVRRNEWMCADESSLDGAVHTSPATRAEDGASQWEIVPCGPHFRIRSVAKDAWLHASGDEFRIGNSSWDNPHRRQVLVWATGAEPLHECDDDASKWEFVANGVSEVVRIKNVKNGGWMYPNAPEYGGVLTYVGAEFPQDRAYTEWQVALSVEHLQETISRLSRENSEQQQDILELNREKAEHRREIKRLSRESEGLKEDKSGQVQFFENLFGQERASLQQTIDKLQRDIASLEEELEKLNQEKADQQQEIERLHEEQTDQRQTIENLIREKAEQEELMETLTQNMVRKVASSSSAPASSWKKSSKRR